MLGSLLRSLVRRIAGLRRTAALLSEKRETDDAARTVWIGRIEEHVQFGKTCNDLCTRQYGLTERMLAAMTSRTADGAVSMEAAL